MEDVYKSAVMCNPQYSTEQERAACMAVEESRDKLVGSKGLNKSGFSFQLSVSKPTARFTTINPV